jgi:4-hydroxybenzoate polyprenyltransferase
VLAILYVLRVLAGGAAIGVEVSPWLLALSFALFASLALAKRYVELAESPHSAAGRLPGRGYERRHLGWLRTVGLACAVASALIIALYAASLAGSRYYSQPAWLYALAPIVLAWLARVWLRAGDGRMHDDPVVDSATDPLGLAIVAGGIAAFVAAL